MRGTTSESWAYSARENIHPAWRGAPAIVGQTPLSRATPTRRTMAPMQISLRFLVYVMAVVLAGHQLVYAASYGVRGVDQALSSAGHGAYWLITAALVSLALATGVLLGMRRWMALRRQLRVAARFRRRHGSIDWRTVRASVLHLAPRLALSALAIFLVQENLEHSAYDGGHVPGLGVLIGSEYTATIPIFALVAALVAGIISFLQLSLSSLARLVDRLRHRRPERVSVRPSRHLVPGHRWLHFTPDLGRAPPFAV